MRNGEEVKRMLKNFRTLLILHKIEPESIVAKTIEEASERSEEFSEALKIEIETYGKILKKEKVL